MTSRLKLTSLHHIVLSRETYPSVLLTVQISVDGVLDSLCMTLRK